MTSLRECVIKFLRLTQFSITIIKRRYTLESPHSWLHWTYTENTCCCYLFTVSNAGLLYSQPRVCLGS